MPTVGPSIAHAIATNDGHYEDDPRVVRIVRYTDMSGKLAYGLEYEGHLGQYEASEFVRKPKVYWQA
jgi:hypothetical protein